MRLENFIQIQEDFVKHKCLRGIVPLQERFGSMMNNLDLILLPHIFLKDVEVWMMSFYQTRVLPMSDSFRSWFSTCGCQVSSEEHGEVRFPGLQRTVLLHWCEHHTSDLFSGRLSDSRS